MSKFDYAVQPKTYRYGRLYRLVKFLTTPGECGESPIETFLAGIFMVLSVVLIFLFAALISVG